MRDDVYGGIHDGMRQQGVILQDLANACHSDEDLLRALEERPEEILRDRGIDVPMDESMDVKVVLNTRDTFHLAMIPDPNQELQDEALMAVAGGKTNGCASSGGTVGSIPSTASSISSLGCASSQSGCASSVSDASRTRQ